MSCHRWRIMIIRSSSCASPRSFHAVVDAGGLGEAFPGVNVSDRSDDWTQNYREPDVAVFLEGTTGP